VASPDIERQAASLVRRLLGQLGPALVKPHGEPLMEDYYIVQMEPLPGLAAHDLVRQNRRAIAQIIRGETAPLSDGEISEIVESRASYYRNDLLVAGWNAALVYDTPDGAGSRRAA
jgi:hypothetical protein